MQMCEVQHQHYSCRTRITGFIADNMEGKGVKKEVSFQREGENLGLSNIHLSVYWFLNYLNTYRWLLNFFF